MSETPSSRTTEQRTGAWGRGPSRTADAAERIARDDAARQALQRRTLAVVVLSQVLGGAGLAAGVTVGALLAQDMLGTEALAGLPAAFFTLGSAGAAFLVGRLTHALGRRTGIGLGYAAGGLGALGIVLAAVADSVPGLFAALLVYGSGTATNLQARYAGTDLAAPTRRGFAISVAMVSTTAGAVAGPNLIEPLGRLATVLGVPPLAGPFLLAAVAYLAAGAAMLLLLRPDPYLVAQHLAGHAAGTADGPATGPPLAPTPTARAGVVVGATVMVLTQVAMVAIMTMTPIHMRAHGHALGAVGLVISVHIGAMYLPSLVAGVLVDRVGRVPTAIASGATLLLAGVVAAAAPGDSLALLITALALLGLGWNLGLIAGTALVVDGSDPATRARTQGAVDVLIALGGAGGGAASGMVVAGSGYAALSLSGGVLALVLVPVVLWWRRSQRRRASSDSAPEAATQR